MKHIKTFESKYPLPKIGEYAIVTETFTKDSELITFLENSIGKIINTEDISDDRFIIKYDNIPDELIDCFYDDHTRLFTIDEVLHHSKIRKELELILAAKQYNL